MAGGGGSNNAQVYEQQAAAADARAKEKARALRLKQGQNAINALFEGGEIMDARYAPKPKPAAPAQAIPTGGGGPAPVGTAAPQAGVTSTLAGGGAGGGYGTGGPDAQGYDGGDFAMRGLGLTPAQGHDGAGDFALRGLDLTGPTAQAPTPSGYYGVPGMPAPDETTDELQDFGTGQFATGFGDDFYNKFRQAQTDYYLPDVERQFGKAKEQLTYDLARAGTSQSSIAGDQLADLIYQNQNNTASVNAKADAATADLRRRVAADKSAALSQLYATEDPTMAANEALSKVRTINEVSPELNPLGDIFKLAAIGGGSFASSYGDPYRNVGLRRSAGREITG